MQIAMTMRNALMENVYQAVLMMIIVKKGIDVYIENASKSVSPKGTVK